MIVVAGWVNLPFRNECIDDVFANTVMPHIKADNNFERACDEIKRFLKIAVFSLSQIVCPVFTTD